MAVGLTRRGGQRIWRSMAWRVTGCLVVLWPMGAWALHAIAQCAAMGCDGVRWRAGFAGIQASGGAGKLAESAGPVGAPRPPDWLAAWLPAWRRAAAWVH